MDKREIYEHLAKIYLDASCKSTKKKKEIKLRSRRYIGVLVAFIIFTFALGGGVFVYNYEKSGVASRQISLYLTHELTKINFNFDPAKKETLSLNLKNLDFSNYRQLSFDVRKNNFRDIIALRIELANRFNERGEVYLKGIPQKWTSYRFDLSRFKGIHDWGKMKTLAFCVEEWNTREKSGIIYIDNVRLEK